MLTDSMEANSMEANYPGLLEGEVNEDELKKGETYYLVNRKESITKPREEGKYTEHKKFVNKEMPYFHVRKAGTDNKPDEGWRHPMGFRFLKRPQDVALQRQALKYVEEKTNEDIQKEIRSYLGGKKKAGKSLKKRLKKNLSKGKKKYSRKTRKGKTKKRRK